MKKLKINLDSIGVIIGILAILFTVVMIIVAIIK